jgi:4-amino-4-deoxy-L-arabinose transferase-like glycosyltransferase
MNLKKIFTNRKIIFLLLIILFGGFLRFYHFGGWMHWQLDQARDWRVISAALQYGPGELPLQGPRAAGSFLRLGPLLYYLEYLSALLFGQTPIASIVIIIILSIVTIPLFYLLSRRFFNWKLSMGLTAIFASSIFLTTYSRFGWNPNLIPFFAVLFAYALLKIEKSNSDKQNGHWLIVVALAVAGISQMHFLAFIAIPIIVVIYLLWTRPKISFKYWALALVVFVFMNIPLVINDYKTGGRNVQEFIKAVTHRSADKKKYGLKAKLIKSVEWHSQYNWLILSGNQLSFAPISRHDMAKCRGDCPNRFFWGAVSLLFLGLGFLAWWRLFNEEKDENKKNFLRLVIIWTAVVFALYTKLAYDIAPRFFLLEAPLFFIFLGFILKWFDLLTKKKYQKVIIWGLLIFVVTNLFFTREYFQQLARAGQDNNFHLEHKDYILKEKTRITYEQMEEVVNFMNDRRQLNQYPIFLYAQPEYKTAFGGILQLQNIPFAYLGKGIRNLYRQGNYFVILRSQSDQNNLLAKYLDKFTIKEKKQFGTLIIYHLLVKPEAITIEKKEITPPKRNKKYPKNIQRRYLWRQIFE